MRAERVLFLIMEGMLGGVKYYIVNMRDQALQNNPETSLVLNQKMTPINKF